MTDSPPNFNILKGPQDSFLSVLPAFDQIKSLSLPVNQEGSGQLQYSCIVQHTEGDRSFLPAFTSETAAPSPHITCPPLETALLFFHAPRHEFFIFNPAGPSSLRAGRAEISLLAGFLQAGGSQARAADPIPAAMREAGMGNLHKAHYLYASAGAAKADPATRLPLCSVLVELGLFQEAYDSLKTEKSHEALLLLALIHRKTGNQQRAAEALAAIPGGTFLEERKSIEAAWLDLETGKDEEAEKAFEHLAAAALDKTEALSGLAAVRAKKAFRTKDAGRLASAATTLRSALATPSPASARLFFQLGNLYFRSGNSMQAEDCYRKAAALNPGLQALANLAATLIRTGKHQEAAAVIARVALTDPASAGRLAAQMPANSFTGKADPQLYSPAAGAAPPANAANTDTEQARKFSPDASQDTLPPAMTMRSQPPLAPAATSTLKEFKLEALQTPVSAQPPVPAGGQDRPESGRMSELNLATLGGPAQPASTQPGQASLEPAAPRTPPNISNRRMGPGANMESMQDAMRSAAGQDGLERRPEDFLSGAFKVASDLEREFGSKVHFNREGLLEVEKKLRLFVKQAKFSSAPGLVSDCAAFLCYFLQERHKGRLVKLAGTEPWAWPMIFETKDANITTYPAQRLWRLLWEDELPETGWLVKYAEWLVAEIKAPGGHISGTDAIRERRMSHLERLEDTKTEHKRIMALVSTLTETSDIEIGRPGVIKLGGIIRHKFKPDIPPSADGWKLLRCYGHMLAAVLAKDFKASWYYTDCEDGHWSMRLPWDTFVFPIGKIYKTASHREELLEYYDALLSERARKQSDKDLPTLK
ncbi:MAG: hypothetical protein COT18_04595 [Elusimicrobia bacterium CG08_land_8_20_14_0_20_59_10]|nr:MAG: hypothetical protein COT18_04595 [Elusimicrobia bacterium CG08_land_8_20_14_0_20_59_10]